MKKIFFLFLIPIYLFSITTDNISSQNLIVLNSLNIETDFIHDKDTIKLYNSYLKKRKRYFLNVLENGYGYISLIKNEIKKANIPPNLVFVAMAESQFSSRAYSNKKAVGIWQFIPQTAKKFGLKINDYVDERKDPIKSTIAAIKYLSYLKKKTGKWYLAIMAYNCGEARIIEAITRAKLDKYCQTHQCKHNKTILGYRKTIRLYTISRAKFSALYRVYKKVNKLYPNALTLSDLLKVQPKLKRQYLPKETRKYIRKIVAMNYLLNSQKFVQYQNHYLLNRGNVANLVKVDVPAGTSLISISHLIHVDYRYLRNLNMHLKYGFTPPNEDSYIYIPYQKLALFKTKFKNKRVAKKIIYRVKKGDSLLSIAKMFGIKYKVIKDFNHLTSNLLRINQKLVIPVKPNIKIPKNITYRVKKGDNLRYIAKKFHTTVAKIKKANNIKNDLIYQRQKLIIPTYVTLN